MNKAVVEPENDKAEDIEVGRRKVARRMSKLVKAAQRKLERYGIEVSAEMVTMDTRGRMMVYRLRFENRDDTGSLAVTVMGLIGANEHYHFPRDRSLGKLAVHGMTFNMGKAGAAARMREALFYTVRKALRPV